MLGQQVRLVVIPRGPHVVVHFLKANQVGLLVGDHLDDPLDIIAPVPAADPLVNVVAQKPHSVRSFKSLGLGRLTSITRPGPGIRRPKRLSPGKTLATDDRAR